MNHLMMVGNGNRILLKTIMTGVVSSESQLLFVFLSFGITNRLIVIGSLFTSSFPLTHKNNCPFLSLFIPSIRCFDVSCLLK